MRLKSLRKERPKFETEGAVISGSRIDPSNNDLKPAKHRTNTLFALPTSLSAEASSLLILPSDQTDEMSSHSRQQIDIPIASELSNHSSYQAIEAACLEHGIRIRVSPTKTAVTGQQSGRKSANSLHRHTAFVSRHPSRTSSVLHYATANLDQHHDSRPFSELQHISSDEFEQTQAHNVSYAQSSQLNEDTPDNYYATSIVASETSNPISLPEKIPITDDIVSTQTLYENDPDFAYMGALMKKPSGDSFRDAIRRRAGLRATFAVHRNPLAANLVQPQPREKSPRMNRNSIARNAPITIVPVTSPKKVDNDILKHASRIRRSSQSKDYLTKPLRLDTTPIFSSPPRIINSRRNSANKPIKSTSLEPLALLVAPQPPPRSASLSVRDLPSIRTSSMTRNLKTPVKRTKSAKTSTIENRNPTNFSLKEHSTSSSILHDESLSLMKTSPLDIARQSNSFDSGCYDHSSSSGDIQSLTSSSIVRIPSSIQSARLTSSIARRSNTNKKVSFYEEPTAVILTSATYV